uniref:Uncharacterized protein n=1 Tax=Anopheles coluzzii TaxID=1518534 RepID=A0A8W7P835_ANOCL
MCEYGYRCRCNTTTITVIIIIADDDDDTGSPQPVGIDRCMKYTSVFTTKFGSIVAVWMLPVARRGQYHRRPAKDIACPVSESEPPGILNTYNSRIPRGLLDRTGFMEIFTQV